MQMINKTQEVNNASIKWSNIKIWKKNIIQLEKGKSIERDRLISSLFNIGYERDTIVTETGKFIYKNLSVIENQLPQDRFFRTHRTYLVGFRHIVSHTSADILFDNKEKALISKLKYGAFKKAFVDYVKRFNFAGR